LNVAPPPGVTSTQMRPESLVIRSRAIARSNPGSGVALSRVDAFAMIDRLEHGVVANAHEHYAACGLGAQRIIDQMGDDALDCCL
jgi:hypothetical protein